MKTLVKVLLIIAAVVGLFEACSTSKRPEKAPATRALDSLFTGIFATTGPAPGAVVTVMSGDTVLYSGAFGNADLQRNKPLSDSTVLNAASASKTFIVAALLKLQEQGLLDLDEPLNTYLPEYATAPFKEITARNIVMHTTGLPDLRPRTAQEWDDYTKTHPSHFGYGNDYMLYGREDEQVKVFLYADTLKCTPGTRFEYQNATFLLLSELIERLSGRRFENWMNDEIFAPAGLTETQYYDPESPSPRLAHGYIPFEGHAPKGTFVSADKKWQEYDYGEAPFFLSRADNGIFTTPREYLKWLRAFYNGEVISKESAKKTYTDLIATDIPDIHYGYGAYVQNVPAKPYKVFHSTSNGGFSVFEAIFPRQNVYYTIFANRTGWNRFGTAEKVDSILRRHGWLQPRFPDEE